MKDTGSRCALLYEEAWVCTSPADPWANVPRVRLGFNPRPACMWPACALHVPCAWPAYGLWARGGYAQRGAARFGLVGEREEEREERDRERQKGTCPPPQKKGWGRGNMTWCLRGGAERDRSVRRLRRGGASVVEFGIQSQS